MRQCKPDMEELKGLSDNPYITEMFLYLHGLGTDTDGVSAQKIHKDTGISYQLVLRYGRVLESSNIITIKTEPTSRGACRNLHRINQTAEYKKVVERFAKLASAKD